MLTTIRPDGTATLKDQSTQGVLIAIKALAGYEMHAGSILEATQSKDIIKDLHSKLAGTQSKLIKVKTALMEEELLRKLPCKYCLSKHATLRRNYCKCCGRELGAK